MTPLEMIAEWEKGCSCGGPPFDQIMGNPAGTTSPAQCEECTVGLITALKGALTPKPADHLPESWGDDGGEDFPSLLIPRDRTFAFRDPGGRLTFIVQAGEELKVGDVITIDRETGKIRKRVAGVDTGTAFTVPPGSRLTDDGNLEMPS